MNKRMCEIQKKLQKLSDANDPIERKLALLGMLVEERLDNMTDSFNKRFDDTLKLFDMHTSEILKQKTELRASNEKIDEIEHSNHCPLGMDEKYSKLSKDLEVLRFLSRNPKLALFVLLSIMIFASKGMFDMLTILIK